MKTPSQRIRESIESIKEAPVHRNLKGTTRADREEMRTSTRAMRNKHSLKNYDKKKQTIDKEGLADLPKVLFFGSCALTPDEVYNFVDTDDIDDSASGILNRRLFKSPFLKDPSTRESFINILIKNSTYRDLVKTLLTSGIEGANITKNKSAIDHFLKTAEKQFEALVIKKKTSK